MITDIVPVARCRSAIGTFEAVMAMIALALVVRAIGLEARSMWSDEVFSVDWAQLPTAFLLGPGARAEPTPPLYYLLLKAWMDAFGTGAGAARAFSTLCSALVVPVVWALGRRLLGARAAMWAAFFACIDPLSVFFAETARGYALLQLVEAVMLLGLADATDRAAGLATRRRGVVLFGVAAGTAAWVHYSAVFLAACAALVLGAELARDRSGRRGLRPVLLAAGLGSAVVIAGAVLLASRLTHSVGLEWMRAPTPLTVMIFAKEVLTTPDRLGHAAALAAAALVAIAAEAAFRLARRDRRAVMILVVLPVLYVLVLVGVSFRRPMLLSRCGVILAVPVCLLLGQAVAMRARPWSGRAVAAVATALFGWLLADHVRAGSLEDWRGLSRTLVASGACTGPIVTYGPYDFDVLAYAPGLVGRRLIVVDDFGQEGTAEGLLNARVSGAHLMHGTAAGAFVRTAPRVVEVLRAGYRPGAASDAGPIDWTLARDFEGGLALRCHAPGRSPLSGGSSSPPAARSGF